MSEGVWAILLAGFLVLTFWAAKTPAPTIKGDVPVATTTHFHLWMDQDDADGTYKVFDDQHRLARAFHVRDDRVSELPLDPDEYPGSAGASSVYEHDVALAKRANDFGAWTAYGRDLSPHWQTGIRYSPIRFAYDTLAPDLAVSHDTAGIGLSFYPPPGWVGPTWAHVGLGIWYVAPFDGGRPGLAYGISFSTR